MVKISYNKRLFIYFFSIFLGFTVLIGLFQYKREQQFSADKLNEKLLVYNKAIHSYFITEGEEKLTSFIPLLSEDELRVSIIDLTGEVIFDNTTETDILENHINRPEIADAAQTGTGQGIRYSESNHLEYFYVAEKFNEYFIRTALPYNIQLADMLRADNLFLYFLLVLFALTSIGLIIISNNFGKSVSSLRNFALKAGANEPIRDDIKFPSDELGDIGSYVVQIYKNLKDTRDKLYIEREKLYKHLQISNEGLAFFSSDKKEILANDLFIQYVNLLSDEYPISPEEVFKITEFAPLNSFINNNIQRKETTSALRESSIIDKNGKTFILKVIIFQDNSFEVSINNITQQEEENRLKRQLTQNISHELRTPVSSIQGYLETIMNTQNISEDKKHFFIERSYSQAVRLASLVSDISLLNKMDESSILFDHEQIFITEIVNGVFKDVSLQTEQKKVNLSIHIDKKTEINGNYALLYSVFRNLADNSLAYAGEGFSIIISCFHEDDDFYYFSYADTGTGVPEEHLNRLFERFYRIDQGRSRKLGGTGLGLSIVKNAVLFHKGHIEVKNKAGGGLEFIFSLKKK